MGALTGESPEMILGRLWSVLERLALVRDADELRRAACAEPQRHYAQAALLAYVEATGASADRLLKLIAALGLDGVPETLPEAAWPAWLEGYRAERPH